MPGRRNKWPGREETGPVHTTKENQWRAESFRAYVPDLASSDGSATSLDVVRLNPKPNAGEPEPQETTSTLVANVTHTTSRITPELSNTLAPSSARVTPSPHVEYNVLETFQLLKLSLKDRGYVDKNKLLLSKMAPEPFDTTRLSAAIQCKCSIDTIETYLKSYGNVTIHTEINAPVENLCTALFYAIERNDTQCVKLLLENGANPDVELLAATTSFQMPALGFAIINGKQSLNNPLEVIKTLLAYGADPNAIPFANNTPLASGWKPHCVAAMDISQEYFIYRAQVLPKPRQRTRQIAGEERMTELLQLPYFLIGQSHATTLVKDNVISYVTLNGREPPLVMAFSGPSGHGKTEMAQQFGKLLSVDTTVIDCAQMKHDTDLFGSRNGYQRSDEGSQLNNFLTENDGNRSVVFLDEFDKTSKEIRHSLLLMCDSGDYHDRRNNMRIDCGKTLWILATNLGDNIIEKFYNEHMKKKPEAEREKISIAPLQDQIRDLFIKKFGAPFTGRINLVVPFLPFNETECAIVAHKFLLDFVKEVRQDIDLHPEMKRYVGHCHFDIGDGTDLVRHISTTSYIPELGARSLRQAVNNIKLKFVEAYLNDDADELITEEINEGPLQRFIARLVTHPNGSKEINIVCSGRTLIAKPIKCKPASDSDGVSSQWNTYDTVNDSVTDFDSDDDDVMPIRL